MQGRLLPARGGLVHLPLDVEAVKTAAQRRARQYIVESELRGAMAKMAQVGHIEWPTYLDGMSEMEKDAFIGKLLSAGRGLAGRMAGSGSRAASRVGKTLQRPLQSPVQISRSGPSSLSVQARNPLGAPPSPPAPGRLAGAQSPPGWGPGRHLPPTTTPSGFSSGRHVSSANAPGGIPSGQTMGGGPFRKAAPGAPAPLGETLPPGTMPPVGGAKKGIFERIGGRVKERVAKGKAARQAAKKELKKEVQPKSLLGSLVPGALMAGGAYGLYKGVPAAVNFASQASNYPLAQGLGHRQFQYGYTPDGQAQF